MVQRILGYVIWIFVCILLIITGWDEPLRYKFLSQAEIAAHEATFVPPPPAEPTPPPRWQPHGSALDRGPYVNHRTSGLQAPGRR